MKKILVLILVGVLSLFPISQSAQATALTPSVGSDATDITIGADAAQSKVTEYNDPSVAIDLITLEREDEVSIYATKGSTLFIESPKTLILGSTGDGDSHKGFFKIGFKGDLTSNQSLSVSIPKQTQLQSGFGPTAKTSNVEIVNDLGTEFLMNYTYTDISPNSFSYKNGEIRCNLTAGKWEGTFNIYYTLIEKPVV